MATETAIYGGVDCTLDPATDPPTLVIGGEAMRVVRDRLGKFWSPKIPHRYYDSLAELAEALVQIKRQRES